MYLLDEEQYTKMLSENGIDRKVKVIEPYYSLVGFEAAFEPPGGPHPVDFKNYWKGSQDLNSQLNEVFYHGYLELYSVPTAAAYNQLDYWDLYTVLGNVETKRLVLHNDHHENGIDLYRLFSLFTNLAVDAGSWDAAEIIGAFSGVKLSTD